MIIGIFHEGSGLGNQLFRYITVRSISNDRGSDDAWGMQGVFKGLFFLEQPKIVSNYLWNVWEEKKVVNDEGIDIRSYDPEINFVKDNTVIDGEFQDPRYFEHRMDDIAQWLQVEPLEIPDDLCVIGFRGGEYYAVHDLGLPQSYFDAAIAEMRKINPQMRFEVHTDDISLAQQFFPDFPIIDNPRLSHSMNKNMGYNWRAMRYAKYTIISNSSFYILPRLIGHHGKKETVTIAPRYWARYSKKIWATPSNFYKQFWYI